MCVCVFSVCVCCMCVCCMCLCCMFVCCVFVCVYVKYGIGLDSVLEMRRYRTGSKFAGYWEDPGAKQIQHKWEPLTMGDQGKKQKRRCLTFCTPHGAQANYTWILKVESLLTFRGYIISCNLVFVNFITSTTYAMKNSCAPWYTKDP